jgi:hypothetical protein
MPRIATEKESMKRPISAAKIINREFSAVWKHRGELLEATLLRLITIPVDSFGRRAIAAK